MSLHETDPNPSFSKSFTAVQISEAFRKHKHNLLAIQAGCCPGTEHLVVMNDMVLLRLMLEELGFSDAEIDKSFR